MATGKGYRKLSVPHTSERNIQDAIKARLNLHGWQVFEISQPRAVVRELVGVPDLVAFKSGATILVECKRPGGRMRDSQVEFARRIEPHLRATLSYTKADDVDEFARWLAAVEESAGVVTVREI